MFLNVLPIVICISLINCVNYSMETTRAPKSNVPESVVNIIFHDGQQRTIINRCIEHAPTLHHMLNDCPESQTIVLPDGIDIEIWDQAIAESLYFLAEIKHISQNRDPERTQRRIRWLEGQIAEVTNNKFHIKNNCAAIVKTANAFDYLGMDSLLDYKFFKQLCFRYEIKDIHSYFGTPLDQLNPGLIEKIYATKPKPTTASVREKMKTLGYGYRWHEIEDC